MVSTSTIKYQGDFKSFQFALKIYQQKTAEDSSEIFVYYVGNGFDMPQHFTKGYDLAI